MHETAARQAAEHQHVSASSGDAGSDSIMCDKKWLPAHSWLPLARRCEGLVWHAY